MPHTASPIRHREASSRSRTLDAATVARVLPRALKDALDRKLPPVTAALARLDRAVDRYVNRVVDARARAHLDRLRAEAARPLMSSATTGYVRDAAGKRLRPMTPADLQAIADKHYGRDRTTAH